MKNSDHTDSLNLLARLNIAVRQLAILLIRAYQYLLSPWLGPSCRYAPSCSEYALEALETHGLWKGGWLAVCRICRCHPFAASGYDPVPLDPGTTGAQDLSGQTEVEITLSLEEDGHWCPCSETSGDKQKGEAT